jgi:hypothetical protein
VVCPDHGELRAAGDAGIVMTSVSGMAFNSAPSPETLSGGATILQ